MQDNFLTLRASCLSQVFVHVDGRVMGIDDGTSVHLYRRGDLLRSMRLKTEAGGNTSAFSLARQLVVVTFHATPLQEGAHPTTVQVSIPARSARHAQRLRTMIAKQVVVGPEMCTDRPYKKRSLLGTVTRISGVALLLSAAACTGSIATKVMNYERSEPVQQVVKAVSTPDVRAHGLLKKPELDMVSKAAQVSGLSMGRHADRKQSVPFYIFSSMDSEDSSLVQALEDIDPAFDPVALPVMVESKPELTLSIMEAYCSDDPAQALKTLVSGGSLSGSSAECDSFKGKLTTSVLAHKMSGLGETLPVIIAPNGAVHEGSLNEVPAPDRGRAITHWLEANKGKDHD